MNYCVKSTKFTCSVSQSAHSDQKRLSGDKNCYIIHSKVKCHIDNVTHCARASKSLSASTKNV